MDIVRVVLSNAQAVTKAGTVYSNAFKVADQTGNSAVLITTTAGSITVTQQASYDNVTFYDVEDTAGTTLGSVVADMTVGTKYIIFSPVVARHIRFKIVEGDVAATAVTIKLINQTEE